MVDEFWNALVNNLQNIVEYNETKSLTKNSQKRKKLRKELLAIGRGLSQIDDYLLKIQMNREEFRTLKMKTLQSYLEAMLQNLIYEGLSLT